MTTKQMLLSALILGATGNSISYSMDKTIENKTREKELFQTNLAQLSEPIANFIRDFETWSKEDQDKMETFRNNSGRGYAINGKTAADNKYKGSIGFYLDCRLSQEQITPFLATIDYLKKQQNKGHQQ